MSQNCENKLAKEKFEELEQFINGIEDKNGALISVLHHAQELFGYLPDEVQLFIARKLGIPAAKVNGVVTFYSFFNTKPRGENIIKVCMGTACYVRGAEKLLLELEDQLGIKPGQTTEDGKFTIDALRCVGACGLAPVLIVNEKVYGRVEPAQIKNIVEEYK